MVAGFRCTSTLPPSSLGSKQGGGRLAPSGRATGIGAKVRAYAKVQGRFQWQLRDIQGGNRCQNDLRAHFGLGDATNVTTLRIEWPSGIVQELTSVAANQILTITEPAQLVPLGPRGFQIRCWKGMKFEVEKSRNLQAWNSLAW